MRAVTMKDVAGVMGVSVVSVSKALAGKKGVSEELREKIIRAAQDIGYVYASLPVGEVERRASVCILVPLRLFDDNSFYFNMYRELFMQCNDAGVPCTLEVVTPENESGAALPNALTSGACNGLIFVGEISGRYVENVCKTGTPYIMLDFCRDEGNDDCVISDGVSGVFQLTNHLIKSGCADIGFVGSVRAASNIMDRYLGYQKALILNDARVNADWVLPDRDADSRHIDVELPAEMPRAFVCACDETAYFLIEKLKRLGYKIPEDIAVTGFDDFRFATLADPRLTTYRINVSAMVKAAIARLLRKMSSSFYTRGCTVIRGEMVVRQSTANVDKIC